MLQNVKYQQMTEFKKIFVKENLTGQKIQYCKKKKYTYINTDFAECFVLLLTYPFSSAFDF